MKITKQINSSWKYNWIKFEGFNRVIFFIGLSAIVFVLGVILLVAFLVSNSLPHKNLFSAEGDDVDMGSLVSLDISDNSDIILISNENKYPYYLVISENRAILVYGNNGFICKELDSFMHIERAEELTIRGKLSPMLLDMDYIKTFTSEYQDLSFVKYQINTHLKVLEFAIICLIWGSVMGGVSILLYYLFYKE